MKFTVVIPTRERADTLYYSLKTCVTQDYDNLEILVSDNCSKDNTRDVVESFQDPRIRYINTGKRVSMSSNWEFALCQCKDGYVTYIGDDDALLPRAVDDVGQIIRKTKTPAVSWLRSHYFWPACPVVEKRNMIYLSPYNHLVQFDSRGFLRACKSFFISWERLPMIYNGFIQTRVVQRIKQRTGNFFNSVIPDYYSGFAVLSELPHYLFSLRPFTIAGASSKSTGASAARLGWASPNVKTYFDELDMPVRSDMPLIPKIWTTAITEPLLQANDHCFHGKLRINWKRTFQRICDEARQLDDSAYYEEVRAQIIRLAQEHNLYRYVLRRLGASPNKGVYTRLAGKGTYARNDLVVDGSLFGVSDVAAAAELASKLLGNYSLPGNVVKHSYLSILRAGVLSKLARALEHRGRAV